MQPPVSRTALVEALVVARHESGLSIRRAASLAKVPPSTAQGWFEGKHLPTPALMPSFLNLLEHLGLVAGQDERERWRRAIITIRTRDIVNEAPFVGLRSYSPDDKGVYVGRERALEKLVAACEATSQQPAPHLVFVIGDSGAGKSSLLAAGLVGQSCAEDGPLAHLRPLAVSVAELPDFVAPAEPTLVIVDQFEEAQRLQPEAQAEVFDALSRMPQHVVCVVAVTADAFGFVMRDDRLATHLASPVLVGSLTENEYRRIIEEPAHRHGRQVSAPLVQLLLRDMRHYGEPTPGVILPLLSNALRRCWLACTGDTLTTSDYLATKGLWSSLDEEAEAIYGSLAADEQVAVRRIMLSLVQLEGTNILRRRIPEHSLEPTLATVLQDFIAARLVVREDGQLQISHDALLSRWGRLRQWVEEEKASLLVRRRINMAAQLWDEGGRQSDALVPVEAQLWRNWSESENATLLSRVEHDFIQASLDLADANQHEQQNTIRRLRQRQHVALVAAAIAVVMMVGASMATIRSEEFRRQAEATTHSAQARQIALIADELRDLAPNVASQLSVASLALDQSVESRSAVLKSGGSEMPTRFVGPNGDILVAYSDDGSVIVSADGAGTVSLWREGGLSAIPEQFDSGGGQLFTLSLATIDDRLLAFVGGQQTGAIWDVTAEPTQLGEYGADTVAYSSAWQGEVLLFGTLGGEIRRIDSRNPDQPEQLPGIDLGEEFAVTGLAASNEWILAGGRENRMEVLTAAGESHGHVDVAGSVLDIDPSPDADEFLVGTSSGAVFLWGATGDAIELLDSTAMPTTVAAVRHLGDRFYVGGGLGDVRVLDRQWNLLDSMPARTVVTSIDVREAGVLVGATEGTVAHWDPAASIVLHRVPEDVRLHDVIRGETELLIGTSRGAVVLTQQDGRWHQVPVPDPSDGTLYNAYYGLSADGQVLVNQTTDGSLITMDRTSDGFQPSDTLFIPTGLADLRVSATGRYLALGYRGQVGYELFKRSGDGWESLIRIDAWPSGSGFSRDESLFAALDVDGHGFVIWRLDDTRPTHLATVDMSDEVVPIAYSFSTDGTLAVGDSRGEVSIYDMDDPSNPEMTQRLQHARSSISQLGYSPDGTRLLAATREGQVWVWGTTDGSMQLELQLTPDAGSVQGATSFGGWIVMSLDDGRTVAWPDDAESAAVDLCDRFGTLLSADEWARLVPGVDFIRGCDR